MEYDLIRTEKYIDSEGDECERAYYEGSDGKQYITGPGYFMLPLDSDGNLILPDPNSELRLVNYTATYRVKD